MFKVTQTNGNSRFTKYVNPLQVTAVTERGDGASCILMTQGDAIICAQSAVEVNARWIAAMRVIYCQHEGERMKAFALSQGA